jgi:hypothetical protein
MDPRLLPDGSKMTGKATLFTAEESSRNLTYSRVPLGRGAQTQDSWLTCLRTLPTLRPVVHTGVSPLLVEPSHPRLLLSLRYRAPRERGSERD